VSTVALQPEGAQTARLFDAYSDRLLAYCMRTLGSRSDAEDAVQTTFLYAHRALARGVVPQSESAWLFTIAKNICRWHRRTEARRPRPADIELDEIVAPERPGANRLARDLDDALGRIPERQRQAILLREWRGLSCPEVASALDLSEPATHALLTRARRSLAAAFENAVGRPVLGFDFGSLLLQLRALVSGATAKVAATAVAVASVTLTGVSVEHELASGPSRRPVPHVVPARAAQYPALGAPVPAVVGHPRRNLRTDPMHRAMRPARQTRVAGAHTSSVPRRLPEGGEGPGVETPPLEPAFTPAPAPERATKVIAEPPPTDGDDLVDTVSSVPLPTAPALPPGADTEAVVTTTSTAVEPVTHLLP
jgi:RNA polymerase sigma factor (sigma-70 family)